MYHKNGFQKAIIYHSVKEPYFFQSPDVFHRHKSKNIPNILEKKFKGSKI